MSVHTGPYVDASDMGQLLQRAGFTLPTVDVDTITVAYPNMFVLMEHLQGMGESNASVNRRIPGMSLDAFLGAAAIYQDMFKHEEEEEEEEEEGMDERGQRQGQKDDQEQAIVSSCQVIYAIGWKKHESQQSADDRGSATAKIGDHIEVDKSES